MHTETYLDFLYLKNKYDLASVIVFKHHDEAAREKHRLEIENSCFCDSITSNAIFDSIYLRLPPWLD